MHASPHLYCMHPLMDSSILKLLDEDEDETMHSGADVEAFTAALNRDIQGDYTSTSQPSTSTDVASALFQGTNPTPSQLFQQWQSSKREEEIKAQIPEHQSSATNVDQHGSGSESQHPPDATSCSPSHVPSESSRPQDDQHNVHMSQALNMQHTDKNRDQRIQKMDIQQAANAMNKQSERQVPFGVLLPVIKPQLDKDKAMELMGLYTRLKNNNITKEDFVRRMRALVGDHMLKVAVFKSQQGNFTKIPPVGQKKPLEAPDSSPSKKQKVSGAFSDQSIEQLNDVTAVSGVNLREEEEQLLYGSKEESRVSEASRKVVQEEEERLLLQKIPLQNKLAEIMARCGVKNRSSDVDRCLSLCVEERIRGLISNLIRLSKQRADIEKPRHRNVITSDIRQQIMSMNQKAREEWEKKQADAEKLQRADAPDGSGDVKSSKVNKEEDDRMRNAANIAALAAVGGDDRLSKWQLMAEQSRQKREGGPDPTSTSQPSFYVRPKPTSTSEIVSKDSLDTGQVRKYLRNQVLARRISVKDVIGVLEREIHLSRSPLIYRLYEKVPSNLHGST